MKPPTLDSPPPPDLSDARALLPDPAPDADVLESSRPMGINIGGHTVTQATEHLPEKQKTLVRWLHHWARNKRMEWKELAGHLDLSTTTLHRIWNDKYRNAAGDRVDIANICDKIAKFKAGQERSGAEKNPEFVLTTVAELINWLCERALRNHRMAFLFGDGQVGKTWGLTQFAADHNGGQTCYWDFPPASGVQYMLKRFAKALLVPDHQPFDTMLEDVIAALDPSKLVLIDNVHRVFDCYQKNSIVRCLNTLQYIYDRAGCGMVLSSTLAFRDQIRFGQFKNALKQLNRRGRSYELMLPTVPPRQDMDRIAAWFGLAPAPKNSPAESIMNHIAAEDGIGVYRLRLLDAQDYAANKKHRLNWDDFVQAYAITEKSAAGKVK